MKALILAAGLGTRLRPLTDTIPKPLVKIGGRPLLAYHFDSLRKHGVNEVLINTHYLSEQINHFVKEYCAEHSDFQVSLTFEPELIGSAGTLRANEGFFSNCEDFFVVYSDNLTNINYSQLLLEHRLKKGIATIASYFEPNPSSKGIIIFDKNNRIEQFIEKPRPEQIVSNIANGGIYVYNKAILSYVRGLKKDPVDIGKDLFPALVAAGENMYIYPMKEFLLDIGTMEGYDKANNIINTLEF